MFLAGERGKPKERRRADRVVAPRLHAYYWTGGRSRPLPLRNISETGAFVLTDREWCRGTIAHFVMECHNADATGEDCNLSVGVWAQVVHVAPEGMGLQFIMMDKKEERIFRKFLRISLQEPETDGDGKRTKSAGQGSAFSGLTARCEIVLMDLKRALRFPGGTRRLI